MNPVTFAIAAGQEAPLQLTSAILIYQGGGSTFATAHRVGTQGKQPVILEGKALTQAAAVQVARSLSDGAVRGGFVSPHLLYFDGDALAWWVPPGKRHVAFRAPELGAPERGEVVPHPGLVFAIEGGRGWKVWALRGKERPSPATPLYQAPYFNVNTDGVICSGNVTLPEGSPAERIDAWNAAFFGSFFTHPNAQPLVRHAGGAFGFWRAMLDGRPKTFPEGALISRKCTLADVLSKRGRR